MSLCLLSAVLLLLVSSAFGSVCPTSSNMEKKFLILEEKLNWYGALLACSGRGMSLATIENKQEQDWIVSHIKETVPGATNVTRYGEEIMRWWIGGSDLHEMGTYIWFSTGEPITYNVFPSTQPDNAVHRVTQETEHCLELVIGALRFYEWNDLYCSEEQYFICEYYV